MAKAKNPLKPSSTSVSLPNARRRKTLFSSVQDTNQQLISQFSEYWIASYVKKILSLDVFCHIFIDIATNYSISILDFDIIKLALIGSRYSKHEE